MAESMHLSLPFAALVSIEETPLSRDTIHDHPLSNHPTNHFYFVPATFTGGLADSLATRTSPLWGEQSCCREGYGGQKANVDEPEPAPPAGLGSLGSLG